MLARDLAVVAAAENAGASHGLVVGMRIVWRRANHAADQLGIPRIVLAREASLVDGAALAALELDLEEPHACVDEQRPAVHAAEETKKGWKVSNNLERRCSMVGVLRRSVFPAVVLGQVVAMAHSPTAQGLRGLNATVETQTASSVCGFAVDPPVALPPSTGGPVVYKLAPCFERQGQRSRLPDSAYLQDIQLRVSRPSDGVWVPYDAVVERVILEDFQRLWKNHALADLSVEIRNYRFSNGVVGKLVAYHITERD